MSESHRRSITPEQMKMLSDIFRIIPKTIESVEDIEKLAPGEMGINYNDGALYFRNPYTGEVFSPNSVEHIKQIMQCWDPKTKRLNADTVGYIKFYSALYQLHSAQTNLTVDTVIRDMEYPSVLMTPIKYDISNYMLYGYPSPTGTLIVYKMNEHYAYAMFIDDTTSAVYHSIYRSEDHMMTGWHITAGYGIYAETIEGGMNTKLTCEKEHIDDLNILQVYVKHQIYSMAHVDVNGSQSYPVVLETGAPLPITIPENNTIVLILDERQKRWIYCPVQEDAQQVTIHILQDRLNNVTNDVITHITASPKINQYEYVVQEDNEVVFNVPVLNQESTLLDVNYGQTVLRENLDYTADLSEQTITLKQIKPIKGDILYFRVMSIQVNVSIE